MLLCEFGVLWRLWLLPILGVMFIYDVLYDKNNLIKPSSKFIPTLIILKITIYYL